MGRFLTGVLMLMLWCGTKAQAQREHFVYLQTENMTPFYIKMNGKTISSTYSGYLILGKLKDSIYPIKLGMLGVDEVQDYGLKVEGRNAGYLVKKLGDKGWGIVDLQTNEEQVSMEWSSAISAETARQEFMAAEQKRVTDSIANAATKAANVDTTAASGTAAAAAAIPVVVAATADGVARTETKPAADTAARIVESPKTEQQRYQDSIANVIAAKEKELKALQAMLAGTAGAAVATAKNADSAQAEKAAGEKKSVDVPTGAVVAAGAVAAGAVIGDGDKDKPKASADSVVQASSSTTPATDSSKVAAVPLVVATDSARTNAAEPIVKADTTMAGIDSMAAKKATTDTAASAPKLQREPCVDVLGRQEVEGLMSKTAAITDSDEIVAAYNKAFKDKCVSTANLKKICNAIASDVTRYRILEAAYPHCLDFYAFPELESLLKDTYYLTKFKALVQQ